MEVLTDSFAGIKDFQQTVVCRHCKSSLKICLSDIKSYWRGLFGNRLELEIFCPICNYSLDAFPWIIGHYKVVEYFKLKATRVPWTLFNG